MASFAIAAEGITDQIIIERMIEHIFLDQDVEVNFLQPSRDVTDRHRAEHGGWELVFEFCRDRASDALATNDFLIIQLDTDCGDLENYGLPLTIGGVARDQMDLVDDAIKIVARNIGDPIYSDNRARIFCAISVHSLESWLLLILYNDGAVSSGFDRLARVLRRKDDLVLMKSAECYNILANRVKRKRLHEFAQEPHSLGAFLTPLIAARVMLDDGPSQAEEEDGTEV